MLLQIHWQNQALVTLQLTQPLALLGLGDRPRRSGRNATSNSRLNLNPFSTRLCYVTPPSRSTGPGSLGTGRPPRRRPAAADPAPFSMPYVKEGKIFLNRTMFGIFFSSFAGAVVTLAGPAAQAAGPAAPAAGLGGGPGLRGRALPRVLTAAFNYNLATCSCADIIISCRLATLTRIFRL